ncbi:MAG: DUF3107 domain-containing protein [Acidimicrobiales bacterium]
MIVRIGVSDTPKELEVEMDDDAVAQIKADVESVMTEAEGVLWLTDRHGRQIGVPAARIAYVDLGEPGSGPKIGFGA